MGKHQEIWIDTNVVIYALRTHKEFSPAVRQMIQDAETGKFTLKLCPMVISECVFVLGGRQFRANKQDIRLALKTFIHLKGVECEEAAVIEEALDQFVQTGIDFVDAYLAAHAKAVTPAHVVTLNVKDFLRLGVSVQTPGQLS